MQAKEVGAFPDRLHFYRQAFNASNEEIGKMLCKVPYLFTHDFDKKKNSIAHMLSMYVANSIIFILVHLWESMLFVYIEMILMEEFHMKMKKLLSILLAVAIVFTMTVSVSASKRLDINGEIVIGTLDGAEPRMNLKH